MPLPPVLFEDDSLLCFDKPAGLAVVPERTGPRRPSLMPLVQQHYGPHVTNVHRLEPEASGAVVCAKSKAAVDSVSGQFQSKTAERVYHALVVVLAPEEATGVVPPVRDAAGLLPDAFEIELPLGPDETQPGRMLAFRRRGGAASLTQVRTLERFGRFAWVECRPVTGRPHQLRVHLAAVGAPILGDALYGRPEIRLLLSQLKRGYKGREVERPLLDRLALHATRLTIKHPVTREPLTIEAPWPDPLEVALKYLRKFARAGGPAGRPR